MTLERATLSLILRVIGARRGRAARGRPTGRLFASHLATCLQESP
jgi:hypothetical protein